MWLIQVSYWNTFIIETKESIKVESRVAPIVRIEIATKLRSIDVGGYEELQIRGFDSEGNTFSSLEGVRFQWEF